MHNLNSHFFHSNKGAVAVEFSIIFTLFFFMLLSSAEISRLLYISASLDLAVSESAKLAKNIERNDSSNYGEILREKLIIHQGVLGKFILEEKNISVSVTFSRSISDIIRLNTSNDNTLPLAIYRVDFLYHPIFFPISTSWANTLLSREVIFAQEY
ncbi:tadE-like family protein [Yersinia rohdei]|uniref:TadE-like family protein n=2 Tax=Yersinia rohdei TaxID=29485 RepID=A0ABN4F252_YERRO|nr:TadE/TadG family type IV pilus assembly protein [Yersinia rohdei]AJJ09187.1 tadE-like family protein [Yersinia rohdei]CNI47692.1 putative tight adherance operon protein [Yersinia rohdei]